MAQDVTITAPPVTYPTRNVLSEMRVFTMTGEPQIVLGFMGAVPDMEADGVTPRKNALQKDRHRPAEKTWEYTRTYDTSQPAALAAMRSALGGAVFWLAKEAFVEAGIVKTDAEIQALVVALAERGVDLWWAIERQSMALEDRIRDGENLGHRTAVVRGAEIMKKAGIPTT